MCVGGNFNDSREGDLWAKAKINKGGIHEDIEGRIMQAKDETNARDWKRVEEAGSNWKQE